MSAEFCGANLLVYADGRDILSAEDAAMKIKARIHTVPENEGGGYWAEVPALPGCMTQGETYDELMRNIHEAIEGWLAIEAETHVGDASTEVVEIAV